MKVFNKKLNSLNLLLRPFIKKNITKKYLLWLSNKEVTKYSELRHSSHDKSSAIKYFDFMKNKKNLFYAIYFKKTNLHIGNIAAYIDWNNSTANLTILIGEKKYLASI